MRLATLATLALAPAWVFAQAPPRPADFAQAPPAAPAAPPRDAEAAERIEIVRQLARHRGGQPAALAQVVQLAAGLEDAVIAELLIELADAHAQAGNIDLAAETRLLLAERFPDQPLAQKSILWLVRTYASSELAHARRATSQGVEDLRRQLSPAMRAALETAPASVAPGGAAATPAEVGDSSAAYAMRLATDAMTRHPGLGDDGALAFQRAVAARRAGHVQAAQALLTPLKHRAAGDNWGLRARMEGWLGERPQEAPPLPVAVCPAADEPPQLDGRLDEPFWQFAEPTTLARQEHALAADLISSPRQGPADATEVRFAHDVQYLYLAVDSPKRPGVAYPRDNRPRPRDGDVELRDHVQLQLDLDRDYATWYELSVDSRGWTSERCCGDRSWNPQWYVAAGASPADDRWIVEAAIPLSELSAQPLPVRAAWACQLNQQAPGDAPSHWSGVLLIE